MPGGVRRRGQWVEPGKPGLGGREQYSETHHYHQYTSNIKPNRYSSSNVCYRGRGKHGVSGRSLGILRGGHTNVLATQSQLAREEERNEERQMWYGGKRGRWREVRYKVWQAWCDTGWLLGVEGGRRGGRGGGVAWRRVAGEEREKG